MDDAGDDQDYSDDDDVSWKVRTRRGEGALLPYTLPAGSAADVLPMLLPTLINRFREY